MLKSLALFSLLLVSSPAALLAVEGAPVKLGDGGLTSGFLALAR